MSIIIPNAPRATKGEASVPQSPAGNSRGAWRLLGWIGGLFIIIGFADIALGWYPPAFGNSEWEFGTISGSLNALTIPVMGIYLLAASAIARGDRLLGRALAILLALVAVGLLVLGFIYVTVIPVALKAAAGNPVVSLGMKKAIAKALLLGVAYLGLVVLAAVRAWRIRRA